MNVVLTWVWLLVNLIAASYSFFLILANSLRAARGSAFSFSIVLWLAPLTTFSWLLWAALK